MHHRLAFADMLRATAIFAVVISHICQITAVCPWLFGNLGKWGVDCFFVLSGYLLSRSYLNAILQGGDFPSTQLFLTRRFFRIWPLYAVAILVSVAIALLRGVHDVSIADVVAHLLFLHGFIAAFVVSRWNAPLWTLAIDAQFYVILPLAAALLLKLTRNRNVEERKMAIVSALTGTVVVGMLWRTYAAWHLGNLSTFSTDEANCLRLVWMNNIIGSGGIFAIGVALAYVEVRGIAVSRNAGSIVVVLGLFLTALSTLTYEYSETIRALFGGLSAAALLYGATKSENMILNRIATSPALVAAATLAYAVYLFHGPVNDAVFASLSHHIHGVQLIVSQFVCVFACTLPLAFLGHRFIERPALDAKERAREITMRRSPASG